MANVRVKVDTRKLRKNLSKVNPAINKAIAISAPQFIIEFIKKGISPVASVGGRFVKYSTSYVTAIKKGYVKNKKRSPVNLTLTGEMLRSITSKATSTGATISFTDDKAEYHNKGTNNVPRRAMLPSSSGEKFNRNIELRLREVATQVINKILG